MTKLEMLGATGFVVGEICDVVEVSENTNIQTGEINMVAKLKNGAIRFTQGQAMIRLLEAIKEALEAGEEIKTFEVIEKTSSAGRKYKSFKFI